MNVQKSIYQCLLRLGVDMTNPQGYRCSKATGHKDLVLGKLSGGCVLLANYDMHDGLAHPDPEVVIQLSPSEKTATALTWEWNGRKEPVNEKRVLSWLEMQLCRGHHFLGIHKEESNVVALHSSGNIRSVP
jgi:hypothetical protein